MNGLRAAAAEAEAILERADKRPASSTFGLGSSKRAKQQQQQQPPRFDIHAKLRELYDELGGDEAARAAYRGLRVGSYLLEKLVARVNLNVLIVNLYPGNKGYSISLKVNGDVRALSPHPTSATAAAAASDDALFETTRWPYEEEDLLAYIDNEELPIALLDLLEAEYSCLFYSGCIVAQIRDFRQAYPSFVCDTHHVLLKPTTQSIINDVNAIVRSGSWGREERLMLESAVILATAPPLCLEPHPAVGLMAARLHHQRHALATPDIRRQARRFSQVAVNRKRKLDQLSQQHPGLRLLDLISKQRAKVASTVRHPASSAPVPRTSSKFPKKPSEVLRPILAPQIENPTLLAPPDVACTVARLARSYERPRTSSDCSPQLMEEYILETERAPNPASANVPPGVFHIKLSILQRPSNQEYLGELYVDRDHVEGERNGAACRFLLGTRTHANRYIQQFTEIFTEEGRKSVRIKHIVPGQLPKVSFTAAMREMTHATQLARAAAAAAAAAPLGSLPTGGAAPTLQAPSGSGILSQHGLVSAIKVPPPSPAVPSPTGIVSAPTPSPEVVLVAGPPAAARRNISASLPLLQAQLQAGPQTVQQLQQANAQPGGVPLPTVSAQLEHAKKTVQGQALNSIHHIQLHQAVPKAGADQLQTVQMASSQPAQLQQHIQSAQQTANQLLAQQLTNPPQPINPHKLQSTIIHIQHPLQGQLLQQKVSAGQAGQMQQAQGQQQQQHVTLQAAQQSQGIALQSQPNVSLQAPQSISVQQSQQQQQSGMVHSVQAQSSGISLQNQNVNLQAQQNAAISALVTSLMNSAQQFTKQQAAANAAAKNNNAANNIPNTTGNNATILNLLNSAPAAMTNTSAPSVLSDGIANNSKKTGQPSALLERLMAPPAPTTPAQQTLQPCVQVQIPGLSQPISLSLSAATGGSGLLVSVPVSQPTPPSTKNVLQIPITAHLMTKTGTPLLVQRPRVAPRQIPTKISNAPGTAGSVQYIAQQPTSIISQQQRRRSNPNEPNK